MKRFIKSILIVCLTIVLAISTTGCGYRGYRGKHKGAYTLIYSQVPDVLGARSGIMAFLVDPQIIRLQEDGFGRALYLYIEDAGEMVSICIVQKETKKNVYFYPEQSTLSFRVPYYFYESYTSFSKEQLKLLFNDVCSDEQLENFKANNDWNLPLIEEKLDSAPIILPRIILRWEQRTNKVNLSDEKWEKYLFKVAVENGHDITDDYNKYFSYSSWMATDDYGRRLYYLEGVYYEYFDNYSNISSIRYFLEMVAIIKPDGTFDEELFMVELVDKANYQEQIRALKIANNWNQPFKGE